MNTAIEIEMIESGIETRIGPGDSFEIPPGPRCVCRREWPRRTDSLRATRTSAL